MTKGFQCKSFSIGLPEDAADQSLTALFRHVSDIFAEGDPISMGDIITVSFQTDLGHDGIYRGAFTVVFDDASGTPTAVLSPSEASAAGSAGL